MDYLQLVATQIPMRKVIKGHPTSTHGKIYEIATLPSVARDDGTSPPPILLTKHHPLHNGRGKSSLLEVNSPSLVEGDKGEGELYLYNLATHAP